jgi:hypothetical protein
MHRSESEHLIAQHANRQRSWGSGVLLCGLVGLGCTRAESGPPPRPDTAAEPASSAPASSAPVSPAAAAPEPSASAWAGPVAAAPTRYPLDRTHSPLTRGVVEHLRGIRARDPSLRDDSFAKIGDSVTASGDFFHCLVTEKVRWGQHADLRTTVEEFRAVTGPNPFQRESLAARIGWSAYKVLEGHPSPLERELAIMRPRYAVVMFGTNDIEIGQLHYFADRIFDLVEQLTERGVVPILSTIMPRQDRDGAAASVARYNAVIRGIAQARQVPLVDYHRELVRLPGAGVGEDGIHPKTYVGSLGRNACDFTDAGLRYGYNLRNLLMLRALQRVSVAVTGASFAPEPDPAPLARAAVAGGARVIPALPFVDARLAKDAGQRVLDGYSCPSKRSASGPEFLYQFGLEQRTTVRIMGFDRGGADVDLWLMPSPARPERCLGHGRRTILTTLPAGTYALALEVVSAGGADGRGDVMLVVQRQ